MIVSKSKIEAPSDDKRWKLVNATMRRNGYADHALIEALHSVQDAFGFLLGLGHETSRLGVRVAHRLLGDTIFANVIMVGAAWQQGLVPVSLDALLRAIELNGVRVDDNKRAFTWGRIAAHDPDAVARLLDDEAHVVETLDGMIERRRRPGDRKDYFAVRPDSYLTLIRRREHVIEVFTDLIRRGLTIVGDADLP